MIKSQTAQLAELANSVGECKDINEDQAKQIKDLESSTAECEADIKVLAEALCDPLDARRSHIDRRSIGICRFERYDDMVRNETAVNLGIA